MEVEERTKEIKTLEFNLIKLRSGNPDVY